MAHMGGELIMRARQGLAKWIGGSSMRANDGFVNQAANLGGGGSGFAGNLLAAGTYEFNRVTMNQTLLRAMYRGSPIVAQSCDFPAEDMTKAGVEPLGQIPPERWTRIETAAADLDLWPQLCEWIRWGRLFGGAVLVPIIDGQSVTEPLRPDSVRVGQVLGFDVFDRWRLIPDMQFRVTAPGRWRGFPAYYSTMSDGAGTPAMRIHHSRCFRYDGSPLPHWERIGNMMWGMSVIERIFQAIQAYDSTNIGAAQLAIKSHLRALKIPGLFDVRAQNSVAWNALLKRLEDIRLFQSSEGIIALDGTEEMQHFTQTFAGLNDLLIQFRQQVCGAVEIPEVRLFRVSANGLNASDEWALNSYYDDNHTRQKTILTAPLMRLYDLVSRHATGEGLPPDFALEFRHLAKPNPEKRATVAVAVTGAILQAYDAGLIRPAVALQELRQTSQDTGLFSNITDEDVRDAEDMPPKAESLAPEVSAETDQPRLRLVQ